MQSELLKEKLTVSKNTGKIVNVSEISEGESTPVKESSQTGTSMRESDSSTAKTPRETLPRKRQSNPVKTAVKKSKKAKKRVQSSSSESSSSDSSSDESTIPGLAVGEYGISALENLSTAESDLIDEYTLYLLNTFNSFLNKI